MDQKEHQGTMRKIKGSIEPYRDQYYSLETKKTFKGSNKTPRTEVNK